MRERIEIEESEVRLDAVTEELFLVTLATAREAAEFVAKTAADLEWDQVRQHVLTHVLTDEGMDLVQGLGPVSRAELAEARFAQVAQYQAILEGAEEAPLRGARSVRRAVEYARREGILSGEDLDAIGRTCDVVSRVRRFFKHRVDTAPTLWAVASGLDPVQEIRETLQHAIEPGGRLTDHASPDLRRLRRDVQNQTERIKARVEKLLRSEELEGQLQDDYFTMREERYVLPVRVSAKRQVDGIIHGYSQTGQTAYIEPQELIELNNQLRWTQNEVEQEERRILARLSGLVAEYGAQLIANSDTIAYLDLTHALGCFARDTRATVPRLGNAIDLRAARHPLLYLKLKKAGGVTVPNDIRLDEGRTILIVSGPNTGGKTVLLKTLGITALMVQSGVPIACAEGSAFPFLKTVFTDIGDEQSIERDLSTFSGHLVNINGFLPQCGEGSLVVLDELFAGTDPQQGTVLAVALLEEFARRGTRTLISTHLEGMKTLALEDERFVNASMGFDVAAMQPTYELMLGVPGSSYALRIADRLGFPAELVARAADLLEGEGKLSVDEVLSRLEDQAADLRKEQRRYEQLRNEAEKAKKRADDRYHELRRQEKELLHEESRALKKRLDDAKNTLRDYLKALSSEDTVTRRGVDEVRNKLQHVEKVVEEVRDATRVVAADDSGLVPVALDEVEDGMNVYVASFRRAGAVDGKPKNGEVAVRMGVMRVSVKIGELYYPNEQARRRHRSGKEVPAPAPSGPPVIVQTPDNTVDLRGERVDEALERLELFLDAAYLRGEGVTYVIHGHGTGALKRAVRDWLAGSQYVLEYKRAEREEGGDGVTLAFLGDR